jgi:uncharacterized protein YndB with AHSA1/START domain
MTERSVTHTTFTLERRYDAPPARVFAAWADPAAKTRWFVESDDAWATDTYDLDFRVGGREHWRGGLNDGPTHTYHALYQDIVPGERIVYAYDMHIDDARISVSLATVEFKGAVEGTRLLYTEQGAFLDGLDSPDSRRHGMGALLDSLEAELVREGVGS